MKKNNMVLTFAALGLAIIGAGVFYVSHNDSVPEAQILSVNPNMVKIHSLQKNCTDQDYTTKVKNPNRNIINGLFDSKNHPEYINQTHQKQVCNQVMIESQIQVGYVVQYQIKKHTASMVLTSAPQVGSSISLVELDSLAESNINAVSVGSVKTENITKTNNVVNASDVASSNQNSSAAN